MTVPHPGEAAHTKGLPIVATLGALGVVYGDIGTSPLYALKEAAKAATHGGPLTHEAILGVVSLILWALILIISIKYALLILRADNRGEGGIVALLALLHARNAQPGTWRAQLLIVGLIGAALIYGDGAITPAISVLSALEGLNMATPALQPYVVPTAVVILLALFAIQSQGTATIGHFFGPVMLVWFIAIAAMGISGIVQHPSVFAALNPVYGLSYLFSHGATGFLVVGAVFLCVTGAEADLAWRQGAVSRFEFIDFRRDIVVGSLFGGHQFLGKAAPKITLCCFHQSGHQIFRDSFDRSILIEF